MVGLLKLIGRTKQTEWLEESAKPDVILWTA
jgi:hypothetical protein